MMDASQPAPAHADAGHASHRSEGDAAPGRPLGEILTPAEAATECVDGGPSTAEHMLLAKKRRRQLEHEARVKEAQERKRLKKEEDQAKRAAIEAQKRSLKRERLATARLKEEIQRGLTKAMSEKYAEIEALQKAAEEAKAAGKATARNEQKNAQLACRERETREVVVNMNVETIKPFIAAAAADFGPVEDIRGELRMGRIVLRMESAESAKRLVEAGKLDVSAEALQFAVSPQVVRLHSCFFDGPMPSTLQVGSQELMSKLKPVLEEAFGPVEQILYRKGHAVVQFASMETVDLVPLRLNRLSFQGEELPHLKVGLPRIPLVVTAIQARDDGVFRGKTNDNGVETAIAAEPVDYNLAHEQRARVSPLVMQAEPYERGDAEAGFM